MSSNAIWSMKSISDCKPEDKSTSESSITDESSGSESNQNDIYFYTDVSRSSVLKLIRSIRETGISMLSKGLSLGIEPPPIRLHIYSYGGTIYAGLAVMDVIINSPVPVHTYVEGMVASAGTFFSIVGKKRYMSRNSYMLIHQLNGMSWGTYHELKDQEENRDEFMRQIKQIYKQYTKTPMKELDEILKHDLNWNAEKCLEYGLIDEIIG